MSKRIDDFQKTVWGYYDKHARQALPWRKAESDGSFDPYKILVSEIMLQQTQVARVVSKFTQFIERFPDVQSLASVELGEVLRYWQGLGYNRRAKYLWQAAQTVHNTHDTTFPQTVDELVKLPGVGPNTAGAIMAYAFNQPTVYIETNIRTVYIHHFFADNEQVADSEIIQYLSRSLPSDPSLTRDWYWALMDYGSFLKSSVGNLNKLSSTYARQSRFKGSRREVRGQVLRLLTEREASISELKQNMPDDRLFSVLDDLVREGLVRTDRDIYSL